MEQGVHESLKGLSGVFEAKRHEKELKKAERCDYRRFRDVVFIHWHLIVSFL